MVGRSIDGRYRLSLWVTENGFCMQALERVDLDNDGIILLPVDIASWLLISCHAKTDV